MPCKHIVVSGVVQGVGFRSYTQMKAERLGITGTVRNLANGDVEIVAEGGDETLHRFLDAVRRGPPGSRVDDVAVEERVPAGFASFGIVRR